MNKIMKNRMCLKQILFTQNFYNPPRRININDEPIEDDKDTVYDKLEEWLNNNKDVKKFKILEKVDRGYVIELHVLYLTEK